MQDAYNNYYLENRDKGPVTKIRGDFEKSVDYYAIQNQAKLAEAKLSGKQPDIKNGDPIATFDANGKVVIKTYYRNEGRGK